MKNSHIITENAVSPVVGIMLMLVVVIIIAAVVSGFAGSLTSGEQKAPSVSIETKISNTGLYMGSQMLMEVKAVSEPISSDDLKLVTSWSTTCKVINDEGYTECTEVGQQISGGNTSLPHVANTDFSSYYYPSPIGFGPGVESWSMYQYVLPEQHWGNFSLTSGTRIRAYPVGPFTSYSGGAATGGYGPAAATYKYVTGTAASPTWVAGNIDSMQAVLGAGWENLRAGDIVKVKLVHIPSGKAIYDAQISVEGPK